MKYLCLLLILTIHSLHCYSQSTACTFTYRFYQSDDDDFNFPSADTSAMKKKAVSMLTNSIYLYGIVNSNGTHISTVFDESNFQSKNTNPHFKINSHKTSNDPIIFYRNGIVIKSEHKDTSCFLIDSSLVLVKTGKRKMINTWECFEYMPQRNGYKHMSIWASVKVPNQVMPGPVPGVNGGIVAIANRDKQIKLVLAAYKKEKNTRFTPLKCSTTPTRKFNYVDVCK